MGKANRSVVRNQAYRKSEFSIRERHNERMNESYYNADIQRDRQHLNICFKHCEGSYAETFDAMLAAETISTRGLKADAKVFDEFVFDVNTEYFDRNGGYEYAKSFFEEAYRLAVKEIGGEEYVLSAIMHADERNKALSEKIGRDVYHYHLHVVYIPIVDKEILWTKRCKDPALVGTVKEVIKQVSHSKKWPRFKADKGWVNSYSLLQDRFHDHMKNAGYIGFERGERGSTAEHLSVLEYKSKQEAERAAALAAEADAKQQAATELDAELRKKERTASILSEKAEKERKNLTALEKKTAIVKAEATTFDEIKHMGDNLSITGKTILSPADWKKVSSLAMEGIKSRSAISNLKQLLSAAQQKAAALQRGQEQGSFLDYVRLLKDTSEYREATKLFPDEVDAFISNLLKQGKQQLVIERGQRYHEADRG